jgi:hypothetical protein
MAARDKEHVEQFCVSGLEPEVLDFLARLVVSVALQVKKRPSRTIKKAFCVEYVYVAWGSA